MNTLYRKLILLTVIPFSLSASSLKDIMHVALENSTTIKSMNYDIQAKEQTLKSVSNTLNPTINIGANYNRLDLDVRSTQVGSTTNGYIKFGIDLYDGGRNNSIKKQKKYELDSTKLSVKNSTKEILLQVVTLFFQIKTVDETIKSYEEKSKSLEAEYRREKNKYDINMVTIDEVLKLQSEYESNNYTIEDLKYQRDSLYENLSLLVGVKITSLDDSKLPEVSNIEYRVSSNIKSLQKNIQAINENISLVNATKKPKIKIEDSVSIYHYGNYNESILKDLPDTQNQFMISFSLNLYDSSTASKKESAMLAKLAKNEQLNYEMKKEKIAFNLAKRKLSTQMIKIKSAKSAMEMGDSVYEIILTKYKNGIVDNIAYLDALSKKTTNRALYIQALNNYEIAKANYYFTSGIDYEKVINMNF